MRWLIAFLMLSTPLAAQDRDGNNTPGEWVVTHYETFGIWNSICDERPEQNGISQRCYIRWVDIFSPRPKFAAQFLFVTPEPDGPQVDFGIEAGTFFAPDGFRITDNNGAVLWSTARGGCLTGLTCTFAGADATPVLDAMHNGAEFRFTFTDRHATPQDLTWSLAGFAESYVDFVAQSQARNLP
ncbi:hypothetical protein [Shimia sp.]|uniref:hypothetical protein n=1 Tax=Shimia sp. TaxID=1954381 RepID=UPI0032974932